MDEKALQATMRAAVSMTLREMDAEEVLAQRLAVLLGGDPRQRYGYAKMAHLYTEADGTKMHGETEAAFLAVSGAMLGI
jgi:hypothetical protein